MRKLIDTIRSARKIEWLLLLLFLAVLTLYLTGTGNLSYGDSDLETELRNILRKVEGAGDVEVMVVQTDGGAVEGVLLVTKAAENIPTCLRLQRAVHTLLGVEISRIEVVQRGE